MRRRSLPVRLAAWHTFAVALLLAMFSGGTWLFVTRTTRARADGALADLTRTFVDAWAAERSEQTGAADPARAAAADVVREFRYRDQRVLVFDGAGQLVAASDTTPLVPGQAPASVMASAVVRRLAAANSGESVVHAIRGPGRHGGRGGRDGPMRARFTRVVIGQTPFVVATFRSVRADAEALDAFGDALGVAVPVALALAAAGGYVLTRASLAPAVAMARRAAAIGEDTLATRLPVRDPHDELGELAQGFNALLDRVEAAFERQARAAAQQRQFMADASHELRTPVTALTTVADVALARTDRPAAELVEVLEVVRGEGQRLGRIVDELLLLARADAGQLPVRRERVYLEEVVEASVRAARGLAAVRGVRLDAPLADEAPFLGDPHLLRRLLGNLLDNAIKYTPGGGRVRLTLDRSSVEGGGADAGAEIGGSYVITVSDTGCGIAVSDQPRVFERFYRADPARTRDEPASTSGGADGERPGGAGLGLAIAQWIASEHGGAVTLAASGEDGSRFVVTLPIRLDPTGPERVERGVSFGA